MREEAISRIAEIIKKYGICGIYGPVGIGKTTLLKQYLARLANAKNILPIYVRALPGDKNLDKIALSIAKSLISLEDEYPNKVTRDMIKNIEKIAKEGDIVKLISLIKESMNLKLVIAVDDAQNLRSEDLRSIIQLKKQAMIILASIKPIRILTSKTKKFILKPLTLEEFQYFSQSILRIKDPDLVEKIYQVTNGYPFYARVFVESILSRKSAVASKLTLSFIRNLVREEMANGVLGTIIEGILNIYLRTYGSRFLKLLIEKNYPLSSSIVHELHEIGLIEIDENGSIYLTDTFLATYLKMYSIKQLSIERTEQCVPKREFTSQKSTPIVNSGIMNKLRSITNNANMILLNNGIRAYTKNLLIEVQLKPTKESVASFVKALEALNPPNAVLILPERRVLDEKILVKIPDNVRILELNSPWIDKVLKELVYQVKD